MTFVFQGGDCFDFHCDKNIVHNIYFVFRRKSYRFGPTWETLVHYFAHLPNFQMQGIFWSIRSAQKPPRKVIVRVFKVVRHKDKTPGSRSESRSGWINLGQCICLSLLTWDCWHVTEMMLQGIAERQEKRNKRVRSGGWVRWRQGCNEREQERGREW